MSPSLLTEADLAHLRQAIELGERGRGRVSPNPVVGAVLVDGDEVIGEGWHAELGDVHAEVAALEAARAAGAETAGSTLYVSLEPCAHHGRQPPCTDAILAAGVSRVVIASDDPTEKASGRGPGILRDEGVEVGFAEGAEAAAARLANQPFRKHARTGRPLVVLKSALSLDGFTATAGGDSKWISGVESRATVHRWRVESDAIAVGISTALADDPQLTARDVEGPEPRQPLRLVFDSHARLPLDSALVRSAGEVGVVVVASERAPSERVEALRAAGVEVLALPGEPRQRLGAALDELGRRRITSLLVEGGARLAGAFLDAGEVDELRLFIAPVLLGAGLPLAVREGAAAVSESERPLAVDWERSGDDVLVRARLREW